MVTHNNQIPFIWWQKRSANQRNIIMVSFMVSLFIVLIFFIYVLTNNYQNLANQLPILKNNAQLSNYYLEKIKKYNQTTNQQNLTKAITQSLIPLQINQINESGKQQISTELLIPAFSEPQVKVVNNIKQIKVDINFAKPDVVFRWLEDINKKQNIAITNLFLQSESFNKISGNVVFSEEKN